MLQEAAWKRYCSKRKTTSRISTKSSTNLVSISRIEITKETKVFQNTTKRRAEMTTGETTINTNEEVIRKIGGARETKSQTTSLIGEKIKIESKCHALDKSTCPVRTSFQHAMTQSTCS